MQECGKRPFVTRPVHDPHHVAIERLPLTLLRDGQVAVLEFQHESVWGAYVSNVPAPLPCPHADDFLPVGRKVSLPIAVPGRFGFGPRVAALGAFVRPVPDPELTTAGEHGLAAKGTFPFEAGRRLDALTTDISVLQITPL